MAAEQDSRDDTATTRWAQRLGEHRHAHDECAVRLARADEEAATRLNAASLQRWEAIVANIRSLTDAYNAGAKRVVLSVLDEPGPSGAVTVRAGDERAPYLTLTLDRALIGSHGRDATGVVHASELRLRSDRDDEATAAYLLQNWMQHL
jgi:hypothetical protein